MTDLVRISFPPLLLLGLLLFGWLPVPQGAGRTHGEVVVNGLLGVGFAVAGWMIPWSLPEWLGVGWAGGGTGWVLRVSQAAGAISALVLFWRISEAWLLLVGLSIAGFGLYLAGRYVLGI